MKATIIGLGVIAAIMLMLYPEIKSMRENPVAHQERRTFEQQVRQAQDVTATKEDERENRRQESDEEISARKNYQPPDAWRWKFEAQEEVVCEPLWDMPWEISCHTIFERPLYEQPRRHQRQQRLIQYGPVINARVPCRGGCPYPRG